MVKMRKKRNRAIEAKTPLSIEETITDLADSNKPLSSSGLAELSDLNPEELRFFNQVWEKIKTKRQQQIIYRLVELAEDNLELSFDGIFKYRLKDRDEEVRSKAIEGLWENEEVTFIEPLINLMEQDSSIKVQQAAATALGKFAMLAEHQKLAPDYISRLSRALLATINDNSKPTEVRRRALEAVAPLSLPQVSQAIMEAYQSGQPKLKVSAIYAMGKNCDPAWLQMLLKELYSASTEVRYEAAGACGELGEGAATPYLAKLIDDSDTDVQLAAIQALGKIGSNEAKEQLELCLNHQSEAVQQAAEQALYELEVMAEPLSTPWLKFRRPE
jgi:HEAT repeat protein